MSRLFPTSASLQKEYVKKRQRALYTPNPARTNRVKAKVEALMLRRGYQGDWRDIYDQIHLKLQLSDLTINFDAGSWFMQDNTYKTYAQMYQRGVGADGKMVLQNGDNDNNAVTRALADDLVTLPYEWASAHPFTQRRRLYDALSVTGVGPNIPTAILGQPDSAANFAPKLKVAGAGYATKNKDFKPKAKQVFAALNYGQRPHGSNVFYGHSHLVLNPQLKLNAIYYPQDTFNVAAQGQGTKTQAAYHTLGDLMEYAKNDLMDALGKSCIEGLPLSDTIQPGLLVEAHLFTTIKVNRDVQEMVLSKTPKPGGALGDWTPHWNTIVANARAWSTRNNVALNVLG